MDTQFTMNNLFWIMLLTQARYSTGQQLVTSHFDIYKETTFNGTSFEEASVRTHSDCYFRCNQVEKCLAVVAQAVGDTDWFTCEMYDENLTIDFLVADLSSPIIAIKDIDSCINNPCQNNGTCTDGVFGHSCSCPQMCVDCTGIDLCSKSHAFNGGNCSSLSEDCYKQSYGEHCQYVNLLTVGGITCASSSQYDSNYTCHKAYDGCYRRVVEGLIYAYASSLVPSAWVLINLPETATIQKAVLWFYCYQQSQMDALTFIQSDGTMDEMTRTCNGWVMNPNCTDPGAEEFHLTTTWTSYLNISMMGPCEGATSYNAIVELEIWGQYQ